MYEITATKNLHEEFVSALPQSSLANRMIVSRRTLRTALQRFLAGELNADELTAWANLIELHDEVQYEPGFESMIADVIFCISSPEINEPINSTLSHKLLAMLSL